MNIVIELYRMQTENEDTGCVCSPREEAHQNLEISEVENYSSDSDYNSNPTFHGSATYRLPNQSRDYTLPSVWCSDDKREVRRPTSDERTHQNRGVSNGSNPKTPNNMAYGEFAECAGNVTGDCASRSTSSCHDVYQDLHPQFNNNCINMDREPNSVPDPYEHRLKRRSLFRDEETSSSSGCERILNRGGASSDVSSNGSCYGYVKISLTDSPDSRWRGDWGDEDYIDTGDDEGSEEDDNIQINIVCTPEDNESPASDGEEYLENNPDNIPKRVGESTVFDDLSHTDDKFNAYNSLDAYALTMLELNMIGRGQYSEIDVNRFGNI